MSDSFTCEFPGHKGLRQVERKMVKFFHPSNRCLCRICYDPDEYYRSVDAITATEQILASSRNDASDESTEEGTGSEADDKPELYQWYCSWCVSSNTLRFPFSTTPRPLCSACSHELLSWEEWMSNAQDGENDFLF